MSQEGIPPSPPLELATIEQRISSTSEEGKEVIEKIKNMYPEINEALSTKTLSEVVEDFSTKYKDRRFTAIGWEAKKKTGGRWKVVLYFQDIEKDYQAAEWEYNPKTEKLYPFEFLNARSFWSDSK